MPWGDYWAMYGTGVGIGRQVVRVCVHLSAWLAFFIVVAPRLERWFGCAP